MERGEEGRGGLNSRTFTPQPWDGGGGTYSFIEKSKVTWFSLFDVYWIYTEIFKLNGFPKVYFTKLLTRANVNQIKNNEL